jgi:putative transposase
MSPRTSRFADAGVWFHVVNRAVNRQQLFYQDLDYESLLAWLLAAAHRYPVACAGYCIMPNHFHLMIQPQEAGALAAYMRLATGGHACAVRAFTGTRGYGHVYQNRYWSRFIENSDGFLRTLCYVEGNALRGGLVGRAEDWRWGSLHERLNGSARLLTASPVELPADWRSVVQAGSTREELDTFRARHRAGRPPRASLVRERTAPWSATIRHGTDDPL